ncbi:hypothetical protein ACFSTC_61900 [Nonomuraea ferruginea]
MSSHGADWQDPDELSDHLHLNRQHPEVAERHLLQRQGRQGQPDQLLLHPGRRPLREAVAAAPPRHGRRPPQPPAITSATRGSTGVSLAWNGGGTAYAVYRVNGTPSAADPCAFADARNLLGTTRSRTFTDTTAAAGTAYTYYVTALARTHQESAPSAGRAVTASGGGFSVTVDNADAAFTAGATWGSSAFSAERHGADYRFADPVAASDPAWFRASIPSAGTYRVEVWYPGNAGYNSATPHIVAASGGNQTVTVDQRTGGGAWRSIGTFSLNAGTYNVVGVSRWTTTAGYVIADAVRITRI